MCTIRLVPRRGSPPNAQHDVRLPPEIEARYELETYWGARATPDRIGMTTAELAGLSACASARQKFALGHAVPNAPFALGTLVTRPGRPVRETRITMVMWSPSSPSPIHEPAGGQETKPTPKCAMPALPWILRMVIPL